MNLQEIIKKTNVSEHEIEYKKEKVQFFTRPLLASDQEILLEQMGDTLPAVQKVYEAQKEDKTAVISGKDLVLMQTAKRQYAACVLCNSEGRKIFTSYKKMTELMDSKLLDLISDYIDENVKDEHETAEEVTKN